MSKNDKIEKDDAGSKIALLPPAGAYAKQKHEFRALVQELKRLAFEHWYTQFDLGVPVGDFGSYPQSAVGGYKH
jgi:hypothetical protein